MDPLQLPVTGLSVPNAVMAIPPVGTVIVRFGVVVTNSASGWMLVGVELAPAIIP